MPSLSLMSYLQITWLASSMFLTLYTFLWNAMKKYSFLLLVCFVGCVSGMENTASLLTEEQELKAAAGALCELETKHEKERKQAFSEIENWARYLMQKKYCQQHQKPLKKLFPAKSVLSSRKTVAKKRR